MISRQASIPASSSLRPDHPIPALTLSVASPAGPSLHALEPREIAVTASGIEGVTFLVARCKGAEEAFQRVRDAARRLTVPNPR